MKATSIIFYLFGHRSSKPTHWVRYSHKCLLIHTASVTPRDQTHELPIHARYRCRQICQPPQEGTIKGIEGDNQNLHNHLGAIYFYTFTVPCAEAFRGRHEASSVSWVVFYDVQHCVANRVCLKIRYPQIRGMSSLPHKVAMQLGKSLVYIHDFCQTQLTYPWLHIRLSYI